MGGGGLTGGEMGGGAAGGGEAGGGLTTCHSTVNSVSPLPTDAAAGCDRRSAPSETSTAHALFAAFAMGCPGRALSLGRQMQMQ